MPYLHRPGDLTPVLVEDLARAQELRFQGWMPAEPPPGAEPEPHEVDAEVLACLNEPPGVPAELQASAELPEIAVDPIEDLRAQVSELRGHNTMLLQMFESILQRVAALESPIELNGVKDRLSTIEAALAPPPAPPETAPDEPVDRSRPRNRRRPDPVREPHADAGEKDASGRGE